MADGFNPKSYIEQEADEIASHFLTLRKQDLMDLGLHLELSVKATMRKNKLQEIVLEYLQSEENSSRMVCRNNRQSYTMRRKIKC